jgi:hypothetical protein
MILGGYSAWTAPTDEEQGLFDNLDHGDLDSRVRELGVDADPLAYLLQSVRKQVVAGTNYELLLLAGSDPDAGSDGGATQITVTLFVALGEGAEAELKDVQLAA